MKQLTDTDIAEMIGTDFIPDDTETKKSVRRDLRLSTRIPKPEAKTPEHTVIDFHNHTEEEAWNMLAQVAASGTRSATVITGASGILKQKFQQWATESVISPRIFSVVPLNNGSFNVKFHKAKEN
jgi:DNA-nicking Smr family endonuclease